MTELMKAAGLTQAELARRTGIDRSDINRLCRGHRLPRAAELGWISQVIGTTPEALVDGVELPEASKRELGAWREAAARMLRAENERDEARALLAAMKEQAAAAQESADREKERLQAEVRRLSEELGRARALAETREQELQSQVEGLKRDLVAVKQQAKTQVATLQGQVRQLEVRAAEAAKTPAGAMILGGLIGAALASK